MLSTHTCCVGSTKARGGRLLLLAKATISSSSSKGSRLEGVGVLTGATGTSSKGPSPKGRGRA